MIASHSPELLAALQAPVLAGSVGAALTLFARHCGIRFQWCHDPLAHHTHTTRVPRIGGLAVFGAIAFAWMALRPTLGSTMWLSALPILLASLPVLIVGAFDDLRHASPKAKVLAQLCGAVILLLAQAGATGAWPSTLEILVVAPWLVLATNSFNLIDGADGLAAGTAVIIGLALAVLNLAAGTFSLSILAIIIVAACLGFLPFNVFRNRIFLGDSGSLTVGFLLAAIALQTSRGAALPWCAVVLFGYPLSETTLSVIRRALKGRGLFRPDREHLHHKLRHAGFGSARTALVLWLVAAAFTCLGTMLALDAPPLVGFGSAVVLFLALAKSFGYLRARTLVLIRRRLATRRSQRDERLPDIAGFLPFK